MIQAAAYGKIGKLEIKNIKSNLTVANGRLASTRFKSGEKITDWLSFTIFGNPAKIVANHCSVGDTIILSGSIQEETWEKNGINQSKLVLIANSVEIIKTKPNGIESINDLPQKNDVEALVSSFHDDQIPF